MLKGFICLVLIVVMQVKSAYLEQRFEQLQQELVKQQQEVLENRVRLQELAKRLQEIHTKWGVDIFEITAYAPLDPRAIEGVCFSGDPSVTASGAKVIVGDTVAAGRRFPFGTRLYIEGFGWRTVTDRGGRITDRHIDIAVGSREEAFQIGRRQVRVVYEREFEK